MLNLIKADLYKIFHRPYLYVLIGILCLLALTYNLMFIRPTPIESSFQYSLAFIVCLPFLSVMLIDIVMSEELKFGTLKNAVSTGVGRGRLFVGKTVTGVLITLLCAAATMIFFFGSAYLLLRPGHGYTPAFMHDYLLRIAVTLLLVVSSVPVAMLFSIVFQKNSVYAFAYAGLMLIPPLLFKAFSMLVSPVFRYFYEAMIIAQLTDLKDIALSQLYIPSLVAVGHIVLFMLAGILLIRRMEIR